MKNTIALFFAMQFIYIVAYGQDACTPKGGCVFGFTRTDFSDSLKNYYDSCYANLYPNIEILPTNGTYSTTRKFNCHSYAWHVSNGGTEVWINTPNDDTYWEDGSYIEVTGTIPYPGKVSYASDDHSAITTNDSEWFISKWGDKVLAKHRYDDCPYIYSNLKYYKLNFQITGYSIFCNTGQYSLSNTPGGEITWGESNNLTRESVQGSNPCIFSKDSNGSGWISASFTSGCGTSFTLLQKDVWAGRPLQPYDIWFTPSTPCLDQTVIAQARANNTALSATTYEWRNISNFTYHSSDYKEVHFTTSDGPLPYGTYVYVKGTNSCGSSSEYSEYLWVDDCGGGVPAVASIVFTPNPTSGETVLSIESGSKEATLDETTEWDLEIYSETLVLKEKKTGLKGNKYTIQTSGWKEGLYIVRVKYGEEVLSGKLVVK